MDLQETLTFVTDIARQAGTVLMEHFDQPHQQSTKISSYDIVTEADKAAEDIIVPQLAAAFPEHHVVGEEGGGSGAPIETAANRWYVDPLDGTTNFANSIPVFAVSIALTDEKMNPLLGVVYNPAYDRLFRATLHGGATLGDRTLKVSDKRQMAESVLASGFPYDKATNPDNNAREWAGFMQRSRGVRRFGSAALDLCFVAMGRFDGYWEAQLRPWDILAGVLIVKEAGGRVTGYDGQPLHVSDFTQLVASNGHIHDEMVGLLADVREPGTGSV